LRWAVRPVATPVDLDSIAYDESRQVSVVLQEGAPVPVARHSTGQTRTNTAVRDSQPGDTDSDYTED